MWSEQGIEIIACIVDINKDLLILMQFFVCKKLFVCRLLDVSVLLSNILLIPQNTPEYVCRPESAGDSLGELTARSRPQWDTGHF